MGEEKETIVLEKEASAKSRTGQKLCGNQVLCERVLDGWLKMSTAISNERLVSAMTYNESMVCGALYQMKNRGALSLTATQLCRRLQILKPQMNVILNGLEKRGLIRRERSSEDHRQVHILLTREGERVYAAAHQGLIDRLGAEKMSMFADLMHTVAENFQEMLTERNQTEQEKEDSQKIISF